MPKLRIDGDARGGVKAILDLAKAEKQLGTDADVTEKKLTKVERAARRLQESVDPAKRYNRQLQETAKLASKGAVSIEDAQAQAVKLEKRLRKSGDAGKQAFGAQALGQLGAYATGIVSVGSAVRLVTGFFGDLETQAQAAADRVAASLNEVGELQQLADFPEKLAFARRLVAAGIAKDLSQAAGITFQVGSAGLTPEDREFLAFEVGGSRGVAPDNLAAFAAKAKKTQDTLQFGSFRDSAQKLLRTSEETDANVTQVAEATTKFGDNLTALGFSGDAGLAALAAINKKSGNVDVAGTRLLQLLVQIDKRGLSKGTLEETVLAIQSQVDAGKNVFSVLGEQNAVSGFRNLMEFIDFFRQQRELVANAPATDIVGSRLHELRKDPVLAAALDAGESKGGLASTEEAVLSVRENLLASARDQIRRALLEEKRFAGAAFESFGFDTADFFNNERTALLGLENDERLRPQTRLLIAKFLRDTLEEEGFGPLTTDSQKEASRERRDRVVELLELQLEEQQKANARPRGTTTPARKR